MVYISLVRRGYEMKCYKPPEFHQKPGGAPAVCRGLSEVVETVFEDPNEATD